MGTVYLIHFDRPLHHAQHYLGYADNIGERISFHRRSMRRSARAAKLIVAVNKTGINWRVARTWTGDRVLERWLKRRKKARLLCPVCRGELDPDRIPPWCIPWPCNEPIPGELPF